jgi:hypothetical protein
MSERQPFKFGFTMIESAASPPTGPAACQASAPSRTLAWSVAGRLLVAFLLIAVYGRQITLSIVRFSTHNDVLRRLVDVSPPAAKIALEIEARAVRLPGPPASCGTPKTVWRYSGRPISGADRTTVKGLTALRAMVGDAPANIRLQEQVAAIDAKVGESTALSARKSYWPAVASSWPMNWLEALYTLSSTIYEFADDRDAPLANDLIADIPLVLLLDTLAAQVDCEQNTAAGYAA